MSGGSIFVRAVAAVVLAVSATIPALASPPSYVSVGNIHAAQREDDGSSWFETWDEGKRFLLESKYQSQSEALWRLLHGANDAGRSVTVRYDPSAARFDAGSKKFVYPVCSVELDDLRVETARPCDASQVRPRSAEAQIGLALALSTSAAPHDAIERIDQALAEPKLDSALEALALGVRARSYDTIASDARPASEAADRALVASLVDYRKLAVLTPGDVEVPLSIGWALQELGYYEEARAAYQQILKQWPDEKFRVMLRLAALERQVGNVEASLGLINELSGEPGDDGMRFHYHRGWSLNLLGRFDEAIADFTAGMKTQPDYSSAYSRRACSYASIGDLRSALSDMEAAARLLAADPHADAFRSAGHDLQRTDEVIAALRQAVASGRSSPMPDVCEGYWGNYDTKRKPSALLPPS